MAARLATRPDPPAGPAVQQLRAAGALVPLVGGAGCEAKLLTIGTVTPGAAPPAAAAAVPTPPNP